MKKLITGFFVFSLLFGATNAAFAASEIEPNDTWDQAQRITVGSTITAVGDMDRFTFVPTKSGAVSIKTTVNGTDRTIFIGSVFYEQSNELAKYNDGNTMTFNVEAGKTYKLVYWEMLSSGTPYSFTVSYN